jgi:hypothetical protein
VRLLLEGALGKVPSRLARDFPQEITILPNTAFFWPTWDEEDIKKIFESNDPILRRGAYANHLWESRAWDSYLEHLSLKRVRSLNTNFHNWIKPMIAEFPADCGAPTPISRMNTKFRHGADRIRSALRCGFVREIG